MALSIILYISSILAAMANSCGLVKFVFSGLALSLIHLPLFMMAASLHGASCAYKYDAVERVSRRMVICFFIKRFHLSIIACSFSTSPRKFFLDRSVNHPLHMERARRLF